MEEQFMKENEVLQKLWLAGIYNLACERLLQDITDEIKVTRVELELLQKLQIIIISTRGKNSREVKLITEDSIKILKETSKNYSDWQSFEEFKVSIK